MRRQAGLRGNFAPIARIGRGQEWIAREHPPEIYELLVVERGWSAGQYGTFIGQAMIDAVLAPRR